MKTTYLIEFKGDHDTKPIEDRVWREFWSSYLSYHGGGKLTIESATFYKTAEGITPPASLHVVRFSGPFLKLMSQRVKFFEPVYIGMSGRLMSVKLVSVRRINNKAV